MLAPTSTPVRARSGLAVPLVVALLAIVFLGLAAASYFRSGVIRQLDGLLQSVRLLDLAEAAIAEVATQERLTRAYREPAALAALQSAFQEARRIGAVLEPDGGAVDLEPTGLRARLADQDGSVRVGAVSARPVEYVPSLNRGRMRFQVEVTAEGALRTHTRRIAQDFAFSLMDAGGEPGFLLARTPTARIYP